MKKTLSILIPVYNEQSTIQVILDKIRNLELVDKLHREVIVINDGSTDNSKEEILQYQSNHTKFPIRYLEHESNKGKGAALHTGLEKVTGDYIIIQDADLEYDPQDYNWLLKPILNDTADVVYGSRFVGGRPHRALFFFHTLGNKLLTLLSNMFTGINITDMETCYKLFRAETIKSLTLKEKRFGFEPEVTAKITRIKDIRIYEVGVSYYGRTYSEGKKIGWKDGVEAIYCIFKYNLFR